jgi:hypothetical protein
MDKYTIHLSEQELRILQCLVNSLDDVLSIDSDLEIRSYSPIAKLIEKLDKIII